MKKARAGKAAARAPWWAPAVLAIAGLLAYANSLSGPFVFDDRGTIIDNRTIEDLGSREVFSAPHETPVAGRPVVNVSFAVNYAVGARRVTGYHVVNIAIHLLAALALFGIARRVQPAPSLALAIALLWVLHPLNTEAVDYVTQRTESLMGLCYLLTLYCAVRAHAGHRRAGWEVAAVVACAMGMGSKESMVTAPLAVVLFDRAFLFGSFRDAFVARARLYLGLAATWLVLGALLWQSPRNLSAGFSAHDADVWTYLLNQSEMIARYLWLTIWPHDLVIYYGWPLPVTLHDVWPQAILVVLLLASTAYAVGRHPRVGFLAAWFFLTLAPTSSFVPIATEVGAERRMYLALIAPIALAVLACRRWIPSSRLRGAVLVAACVALAAGTWLRNADYRSSLRLAETAFQRWPTPAAHSMLGTELASAGRLPDAERHLRAAAPAYPPARYYLATVLAAQGSRGEAIEQFRAFVASQPPQLAQVHVARALLAENLTREGRHEEAADQYRAMLAVHPDDTQAMTLLAAICLRQQRYDEAIPLFRQVVAARPDDVAALGGLGIALASTGRLDDAIAILQRAVDIDPRNTRAQQNLARALAMRRR